VEGKQKAGMEKFKADFKKKFGADVQIYAPYVYDAVNVLAEAMVKAGSAEPEKYLPELSIGMSRDLELAVACGSSWVRVGTDIFGARSG